MKKTMKRLFTISLVILVAIFMAVPAFAEEVAIDGAPVIGEYVPNPALDHLLEQKAQAAQEYYEAKVNGNPQAAGKLQEYASQYAGSASLSRANDINYQAVAASSSKYLNISQKPQEKDFWCGYAAVQSILSYSGISKSQTAIAQILYDVNKPCPWYTNDYNNFSDYLVPNYLYQQTGFYYMAYPRVAAGSMTLSKNDVAPKVMATIDMNRGVLVCGNSAASSSAASHLPGYPNQSIGHWIGVYGYSNNADQVAVFDPAKSSVISWSGSISAKYTISTDKLAAFASARGIVF